jgi:nicotinamide-nucleotide adenylyltransferase
VQIDDPGPYTARLLLYSPRNADKTPSAADASTAQRAEMMIAQASALEQVLSQPEDSQQAFGVGVGLLRAPTFVGKATALAAALSSDSPPALTFLVGTDTLVRIFDTKYYPEGGMPAALEQLFAHAWLVCVSRGDEGDIAAQDALLSDPEVMRWTKAGKVRVLGHLEESAGVSSTLVRAAVQHGRGEVEKYVAPGVADILLRDGLYV